MKRSAEQDDKKEPPPKNDKKEPPPKKTKPWYEVPMCDWGTCIKCGQAGDYHYDCPKCGGQVVQDKALYKCHRCKEFKNMWEDQLTCSSCEGNHTDDLESDA